MATQRLKRAERAVIMTNEYSGEITQDSGRLLDRFAKRAVLTRLGALKLGQLNLLDGDFSQVFGARSVDDDSLEVTLEVFDQSFYADFAFGGTTAAGEAYMRGSWRCSDLTTLVRIMIKNADVLDALDNSWLRVKAPLFRVAHCHWLLFSRHPMCTTMCRRRCKCSARCCSVTWGPTSR